MASSSSSSSTTTSLDKISKKITDAIASGKHYEAQQLCKSLYSRWKRKDKDKAYDIITEGACSLLPLGELIAGSELAALLCKSYVDEGIALDERAFARVTSVMVAYGKLLGINKQGGEDADERVDATLSSCETFGESAIRWCKKHKNVSRSRNIHAMLGHCMFGNGGAAWTGRAFDHVIRSGNLSELVARTQDLVRRGVPDEEDYILAHMTMRYLRIGATSSVRLMQSAMEAKMFLELYERSQREQHQRPPPDTPLMHFVGMFLKAIEMQSRALASVLLHYYRPSLCKDETLLAGTRQVFDCMFRTARSTSSPLNSLLQHMFV